MLLQWTSEFSLHLHDGGGGGVCTALVGLDDGGRSPKWPPPPPPPNGQRRSRSNKPTTIEPPSAYATQCTQRVQRCSLGRLESGSATRAWEPAHGQRHTTGTRRLAPPGARLAGQRVPVLTVIMRAALCSSRQSAQTNCNAKRPAAIALGLQRQAGRQRASQHSLATCSLDRVCKWPRLVAGSVAKQSSKLKQ